MGQIGHTSESQTLSNGESMTLSIGSEKADTVVLTVDDGTTGNTPATYDLTQRSKSNSLGRFQFYDEETGITYRSVVDPAVGEEFQVEIKNASGASATYEATLEARKTSGT